MIRTQEAIQTARMRLGTPYRDMDCIALIRDVIKRSRGGMTDYRCEGTNWLWRSIGNSGKYRHLLWRQESIEGARAGMLAFKRSGDDIHHVGLVTDAGTVIHSSSAQGCVVETQLDGSWHCLGQHRYIALPEESEDESRKCVETSGDGGITIIDSAGRHFEPVGDWRVLMGGID